MAEHSPLTSQSAAQSSDYPLDFGALSVVVIWGLAAVASKFLLHTFSPAGLQCVRNVCTSTLLVAIMLLLGRSLWATLLTSFWPLLGASIMLGTQAMIFMYGLKLTTASEGALIISTSPVWTALLSAALGLETIYGRNWLGIFVALGGVALVVLGGGAIVQHQPSGAVTGGMLMLLASFLWGLYVVISKGLMRQHGSLAVTTLCFSLANLVIVPLGLREALSAPWSDLSVAHWFSLAYVILISSVYGLLMWYRRINLGTAVRTVVYQYIQPIVAAVAAAVLLHERLTLLQFVGMAVALGGVYLARYQPSADSDAASENE